MIETYIEQVLKRYFKKTMPWSDLFKRFEPNVYSMSNTLFIELPRWGGKEYTRKLNKLEDFLMYRHECVVKIDGDKDIIIIR